MEYKIIAMDFDGTLLTTKKMVTKRTKETIIKSKKDGYIIIGITARNLSSVKRVCPNLSMFNYLILNNGCYLYNVIEEKGRYIEGLNEHYIEKITKHFYNIAKEIDYISTEKYYIYRPEGQIDFRDFVIPINSFNEVNDFVSRVNIFANTNNEVIEYKNYIDNNFKELDSIITQDTDNGKDKKWIAINPKGRNKFTTLKELCNELNINTNEAIFFGDSSNDIEIIENVGLGVAMGNALQEVKDKAKEITLKNDEDGIAVFLEKKL